MSSQSQSSRAWPLAIMAIVIALISAGSGIYIFNKITKPFLEWPEQVGKAFGNIFQTKTTISSTSISLPESNIAELALIQRKILCFTKQENTNIVGSTAVRIIKGEYLMKAGYDLKNVKISFKLPERSITVTLPDPQILSLETQSQETYYLAGGNIKWEPSTLENDKGNKENRESARREAVEMGLNSEIKERMKEKIRDGLALFSDNIVFEEKPSVSESHKETPARAEPSSTSKPPFSITSGLDNKL